MFSIPINVLAVPVLFLGLSSFAYSIDCNNTPTSGACVQPVGVQTMYWSCTNTTVVSDPSATGWWKADASGGQWGNSNQNVYCWNAGSNPPNSLPAGMSIWTYVPIPNREYLLCAHVVPSCGWVKGAAPGTIAP